MFSLISLYFSYRRDVVLAERYVAGLAAKPIPADDQAPVSVDQSVSEDPIALAA